MHAAGVFLWGEDDAVDQGAQGVSGLSCVVGAGVVQQGRQVSHCLPVGVGDVRVERYHLCSRCVLHRFGHTGAVFLQCLQPRDDFGDVVCACLYRLHQPVYLAVQFGGLSGLAGEGGAFL
ncbi:hypothetical protein [Croceicoccus naphthovorans]|uniref:Uncharacterized protein n=1 Tax=Croceicoccus naphthovorans TaxID=1348774 RepID=A0A0G3XE71_9SPHN|nr:hypothetical protein [Croceicoccus naphthovorans]AKM09845.1 hypothetical protein AB433_07385 [Croceicoccus naphthovorans]